MAPRFLALPQVLGIHEHLIERYGGDTGIRDVGLLESALAMPSMGLGGGYLHDDLFDMAAAYVFHICRNHPFVDGNKRTAAACGLIFLLLNGIRIEADEDALADLVIQVASGQAESPGKKAIADFLRPNAR